ncbi:YppG family protein [Lederbergia sp. NSJ-179]|uniref:YppG family protein n=1 Tax=Lederbergia sp. NSJ-179 TaxID=2931402 RepID=UPI001FD0542C|nr:YppG family protein [Lederbergia sp. NSJ-179]MCJ7839494.1 YppG family protein [Lederbergia sp. NSJ-179]
MLPYPQRYYRDPYPYGNPYAPNLHPSNYHPGVQYGMNIPFGVPGGSPYPNQSQPYIPLNQHKSSGYLFQNPLQPEEEYPYNTHPSQYPKTHSPINQPKPTTGPFHSLLQSFKSQDGSYDFNKMVNTAGQLVNAINQVSGMAKGIGGIFKV